jgi:hypothetical protein
VIESPDELMQRFPRCFSLSLACRLESAVLYENETNGRPSWQVSGLAKGFNVFNPIAVAIEYFPHSYDEAVARCNQLRRLATQGSILILSAPVYALSGEGVQMMEPAIVPVTTSADCVWW